MSAPPDNSLLSPRSALVILIAMVVGGAAGVMGYLANHDLTTGVLMGGGAAGAALALAPDRRGAGSRPALFKIFQMIEDGYRVAESDQLALDGL